MRDAIMIALDADSLALKLKRSGIFWCEVLIENGCSDGENNQHADEDVFDHGIV